MVLYVHKIYLAKSVSQVLISVPVYVRLRIDRIHNNLVTGKNPRLALPEDLKQTFLTGL